MLAGVPSAPKAAAAAGHIGAASKAQRAPVSAVDYVAIMIMDASERFEEAVLMMKLPKRHATPWEGGRLAPITIVISRG